MKQRGWNNLEESAVMQYIILALGMVVALAAFFAAVASGELILWVPAGLSAAAWIAIVFLTIKVGNRRGMRGRMARLMIVLVLWSMVMELLLPLTIWGIGQDDGAIVGPLLFWIPILVMLLILAAVISRARRRRIGGLVLSHVAKGVALNLPHFAAASGRCTIGSRKGSPWPAPWETSCRKFRSARSPPSRPRKKSAAFAKISRDGRSFAASNRATRRGGFMSLIP